MHKCVIKIVVQYIALKNQANRHHTREPAKLHFAYTQQDAAIRNILKLLLKTNNTLTINLKLTQEINTQAEMNMHSI